MNPHVKFHEISVMFLCYIQFLLPSPGGRIFATIFDHQSKVLLTQPISQLIGNYGCVWLDFLLKICDPIVYEFRIFLTWSRFSLQWTSSGLGGGGVPQTQANGPAHRLQLVPAKARLFRSVKSKKLYSSWIKSHELMRGVFHSEWNEKTIWLSKLSYSLVSLFLSWRTHN